MKQRREIVVKVVELKAGYVSALSRSDRREQGRLIDG
jgi:hypothetical protein